MIVIRRMIDRQRAYTAIFLKGESAQIFPTTDYEHARILQIHKQDRPHPGLVNDFTDFAAPDLRRSQILEKENPPRETHGGIT